MNPSPEHMPLLALRIAEAEAKLQKLEREIAEIGQPAAHELKRRLDALKIEEHALIRNLDETLGMAEPDPVRMRKIGELLRYIENEQDAVEHDADFLHQAAPSSTELAAKAGAGLVELCLRALNRVIGKHRPLGESVFVNHNHETLAARYGIPAATTAKPAAESNTPREP